MSASPCDYFFLSGAHGAPGAGRNVRRVNPKIQYGVSLGKMVNLGGICASQIGT